MAHGPVLDFPVKDKIVLVTGGGSGIGFAFVKLCLEAGARVVIGDLKLTSEAEGYLKQATSNESRILFQRCDVSSWADLQALITASVKSFGTVPDVYAPVAGVFEPPWSNFWDDVDQDFYKTIRINVEHPVRLTRLAMRALLGANKQGVVCLVASTAGIRANYLAALYSTSKHAVVGFAKSMGPADPQEGVRVVCILPGLVDSPLWRDRQDKMFDDMKFVDRKSIMPEDIARVMLAMVEKKEYTGGTCVLKTAGEERVVEEGYDKQAGTYDPSPRPEADLERVRNVLDKERGRGWKEV